jgi:2-C-methyl-D-erythritol 4-phosphate cytidylyltransferase
MEVNPEMKNASDKVGVFGLIAAAGTGSRMGSGIVSKQLLMLEGIPVVIRSALAFENHPQIDGYRIVASENDLPNLKRLVTDYDLSKLIGISAGGRTRQHSVLNGLRELFTDIGSEKGFAGDTSIVLIHDGARCLVDNDTISRCIEVIITTGQACAAAVPVKDTIKVADNKSMMIKSTPERSGLWAVQTPQGGIMKELLEAYEKVTDRDISVTDDLSVMEVSGYKTRLSMGNYMNIKITTPEDLAISKVFLHQLSDI